MDEQKVLHFKKKLEAELKVVEGELKELGWKNPRNRGVGSYWRRYR